MDLLAILAATSVALVIGVLTLVALLAFDASRRRHASAHLDARDRALDDRAPLSDVRGADAGLGSDPQTARRRALDDLQARLIRTQRGGSWTNN